MKVRPHGFVADLSYAVGFNVYVLPDPFRVIVDLPAVDFDLPDDQTAMSSGLITGYRFGHMDKGRARIVMDVGRPVLISRSFILRETEKKPAKLVVDLVATDREGFNALHGMEQPNAPPAPTELASTQEPQSPSSFERAQSEISNAITAMLKAKPVPIPQARPDSIIETPGRPAKPQRRAGSKRVIVIDPGHGGIDPGAVSRKGTREKAVVLAFSRDLRRLLERTGKYKVVLTRNKDSFISLRDRVKIARDSNADLFVAIHADSVKGHNARGATIYTVSEKASDHEAAELARKENRSDIIAGVDLATENDDITGILIDLAQRETNNHSLFFAKKIVQQVKSVTTMTKRPLRSAGFRVLKAPDVPSVLFELGYLSSSADERQLTSKTWRRKAAGALAIAVDRYFATRLAGRQ